MKLLNKHKEFENIFEEKFIEFSNKEKGYQAVLRGYLTILISKIFRYAKEKNCKINQNNREKEIIKKILEYLEKNFTKPFKAEDIARIVLLSPSYFTTLFKSSTGVSLTDYVHKLRIADACSMLTKTEMSVIEIMNEVGYSDSKFFYQIFKRYSGMTPGEFRKRE